MMVHIDGKRLLVVNFIIFLAVLSKDAGLEVPLIYDIAILFYVLILPGYICIKILDINTSLVKSLYLSLIISVSSLILLFIPYSVISLMISATPNTTIFYAMMSCALPTVQSIYLLYTHKSFEIQIALKRVFCKTGNLLLLLMIILGLLFPIIFRYLGDKTPVLVLLFVISLFPFCVYSKFDDTYAILFLFVASFFLVIHTNIMYAGSSLYESYSPIFVKYAGVWDPTFPDGLNSMLTTTVLHPLLSTLTSIDLLWESHIVTWIILSLVPLGMFDLHKNHFSSGIAYLSALLYMFTPFFYTQEMVVYAQRSCFAGFFIVAFLLFKFDTTIPIQYRRYLLLLCCFLIFASHYGFAFLFAAIIIIYLIISHFNKATRFLDIIEEKSKGTYYIYLIGMLFWYIYSGGGRIFTDYTLISDRLSQTVSEVFESTTVMTATSKLPSFSLEVTKDLMLLSYLLILVGVIFVAYSSVVKEAKITEYSIIQILFSLILSIQLLPGSMSPTRMYAFSLLMAAPLAVIGLQSLTGLVGELLSHVKIYVNLNPYMIFSGILALLLIFGSGVASNIVNYHTSNLTDYSSNKQIDRPFLEESGPSDAAWLLYWSWRHESTITSCDWFQRHCDNNAVVFCDQTLNSHFIVPEGTSNIISLFGMEYANKKLFEYKTPFRIASLDSLLNDVQLNQLTDGDYIMLIYHNVHGEYYIIRKGARNVYLSIIPIERIDSNKVYTSGNDYLLAL